ncbi:MAG TPA: sulfatase-like hydrolase/transferase, partial [Gemmataceae bacterium]
LLALSPGAAPAADDPPAARQPRVLILGDSISIGYTPLVREMLKGEAVVVRPTAGDRPENCEGTTRGAEQIDRWLKLGGGQWDVIHFNFGLHDLKRVDPKTGAPSNNPDHPRQADPGAYEKQLRAIVAKLKPTGAKLIFATTTPVPEGKVRPHRDPEDVPRYNAVARRVMEENGVAVNDLYAFALPRLKQIQRPANVHFTPEGSEALAGEVVRHIRRALGKPGGPAEGGQPGRPNIIFFLSDDQRFDLMGCAGHPILKTPTMDRLAREGVRFENAFVTTAICAASRATLLTGLVERTHRYTFRTPPIAAPFCADSYPAVLRAAGYRTGFVGKFGVGVASGWREKMFDSFVPLNRNPYFKKQPDGSLRHLTEITGDRAIEFLRRQEKGKPFCLSVSFNAPHAEDSDKENHYPYIPATAGLYAGVRIPAPPLSDPAVFEALPEFLKKSFNRERWYWRFDTPEKYDRNVRNYYRMISGVDMVMGRVLDELRKRGLAGETVVIFSGDNGYYLGERGLSGKWSHYEESLRVPLIVYDPRRPAAERGRVAKEMVLNLDVAPTILELAGAEVPGRYQGRSLVPLLRGESPPDWRTDFFCEHLMEAGAGIPKWEGVRDRRWVYARYFEQEPVYEFLHDLQADPRELTNLAGDPAAAAALARLRKRCDELRDRYAAAAR